VIAFLGLGSNMGDRRAHLAWAVHRLAEETRLTGLSSVWETEPVGFVDQPPFLNLVVRVATEREPDALLELAHRIEVERGRERTFRNAPRTLDIDLLLLGDRRVDRPGLTLPHPRMRDRWFVLAPLLELEPELRDPVTGERYQDLLPPRPAGARHVAPGSTLLEAEDDDA
jgi:2-amino-4-hydroxy-6-hydroxymethyldihydropteridine diphosphokinase